MVPAVKQNARAPVGSFRLSGLSSTDADRSTATRERMYIESMKSLVLALIGPFFVVLSPCVSWGQIPSRPVPKVSESEYRLLSDYIVATFTGDKGQDRVCHRGTRIVIVIKTQSDRDDDQALDLQTDK